MRSDERMDAMLELLSAGLTTEQIAERLGISRRTVFRLKLRAKDHAATLAAE